MLEHKILIDQTKQAYLQITVKLCDGNDNDCLLFVYYTSLRLILFVSVVVLCCKYFSLLECCEARMMTSCDAHTLNLPLWWEGNIFVVLRRFEFSLIHSRA